jgi:hypothetical protein
MHTTHWLLLPNVHVRLSGWAISNFKSLGSLKIVLERIHWHKPLTLNPRDRHLYTPIPRWHKGVTWRNDVADDANPKLQISIDHIAVGSPPASRAITIASRNGAMHCKHARLISPLLEPTHVSTRWQLGTKIQSKSKRGREELWHNLFMLLQSEWFVGRPNWFKWNASHPTTSVRWTPQFGHFVIYVYIRMYAPVTVKTSPFT